MSKKEISFTEGPVFQSLLRFAIPVLGALILQAAYGAVDLLENSEMPRVFPQQEQEVPLCRWLLLSLQVLQWAPP